MPPASTCTSTRLDPFRRNAAPLSECVAYAGGDALHDKRTTVDQLYRLLHHASTSTSTRHYAINTTSGMPSTSTLSSAPPFHHDGAGWWAYSVCVAYGGGGSFALHRRYSDFTQLHAKRVHASPRLAGESPSTCIAGACPSVYQFGSACVSAVQSVTGCSVCIRCQFEDVLDGTCERSS